MWFFMCVSKLQWSLKTRGHHSHLILGTFECTLWWVCNERKYLNILPQCSQAYFLWYFVVSGRSISKKGLGNINFSLQYSSNSCCMFVNDHKVHMNSISNYTSFLIKYFGRIFVYISANCQYHLCKIHICINGCTDTLRIQFIPIIKIISSLIECVFKF